VKLIIVQIVKNLFLPFKPECSLPCPMGACKGNTGMCHSFDFWEEIRIEKCEEIYQILKNSLQLLSYPERSMALNKKNNLTFLKCMFVSKCSRYLFPLPPHPPRKMLTVPMPFS
jgi:hypothetical protein